MEESSVAPAQQQSVSTATARTLYNSSRYEPNRYDPYYALYDDDAELYRDVGKSMRISSICFSVQMKM